MNDFAIFILTHGRSENVKTYKTLKEKCGYTGKIYLLIDNTDKEIDNYKKLYGDKVIVFNKQEAINMTDSCDNLKKTNSVVYARNYNFIVAKNLGIKYFLQLDDDYTEFTYAFDRNGYIGSSKLKRFDEVCKLYINFMKNTNCKSICFSQGGDFIGGENSSIATKYLRNIIPRKIMNSFFFCTDKPVKFLGRINEDVNLYIKDGSIGDIFITMPIVRLEQIATQQNKGGLTDIYLDLGTYTKSFYSVICNPACITLKMMGVKEKRIHHSVEWKYTVPKIVNEKEKKI